MRISILSEAESEQRDAENKRQDIAEALGENGTDFIALANLILDENREYAKAAAENAEMAKSSPKGVRAPQLFLGRNWSPEEINGLAKFCATQGPTFNREEWFTYLGNQKKIFVVNFRLGGLPSSNEDGTLIQQYSDDDDISDNGVDYLVEAETPNHAEKLVTAWLEKWQLTTTKLASANGIEEFQERKAIAKK